MSIAIAIAPAATDALTATADPVAAIEFNCGVPYLRVTIDNERVCFTINPHWLRLFRQTVTEEAERLLTRYAGYTTTTPWKTGDNGRMTATVAEITGRCTRCVHGCGCPIGGTGCGHYQCPAAAADVVNTCDGAALAVSAKRPPY